MRSLAGLTVAAAAFSGAAQAVVIPDAQVRFRGQGDVLGYGITVMQSPVEQDPTGLWFIQTDRAGQSALTPLSWTLDEGVDVYLVEAGQAFTPEAISAGLFRTWATPTGGNTLTVPSTGAFYLGLATTGPSRLPDGSWGGYPGWDKGKPIRNVWGWLELLNEGGTLTMRGNAMAYGEGGIIVGTTTPVPEPHAYGLSVLGLTGLLAASARRRRLR